MLPIIGELTQFNSIHHVFKEEIKTKFEGNTHF